MCCRPLGPHFTTRVQWEKRNDCRPLDMISKMQWEVVARILVKGYKEVHFSPVKLNRVFLLATLFGKSDVPSELLMDSFFGLCVSR